MMQPRSIAEVHVKVSDRLPSSRLLLAEGFSESARSWQLLGHIPHEAMRPNGGSEAALGSQLKLISR
jgi:hypothetical protein